MKVLVADRFEKSGLEGLKAAGCAVVYEPDLKEDSLAQAIAKTGADVLVVRSTKVTEPMLEAGRLALVVRAGAGYNTIDVQAASRRGIYVSNCPGKNSIAVAELAFGLILALDRRIPDNVAALRAGKWNKKEYSKAAGLFGRTLALIGIGSIGQEMIRRAAGFGMNVVIWSRRFDAEDRPITDQEARELGVDPLQHQIAISLAPTPAEAAARAEVISLHVALARGTRALVNAELLARVKPGAMLVNTARGEVVDHAALADAVRSRGLRVAMDVYANEPASATGELADPLVQLPGVYGTHHIGASTDQAQEAIAAETVRIILSYKDTGQVPNVVNLCRRTPASHMLVVRHRDRPGVLAHVFDHLREGNINVQETQNVVFDGAEAAIARINLDAPPDAALLERIRQGNTDILDLRLVDL
ncbi:MAG: NAD(P)-dependent oxidoreductase [Vicinamibacterales bacterium]